MSKIRYRCGDEEVEATNATSVVSHIFREKFAEALREELAHTMALVNRQLFTLKPGQKRVIVSKPIRIEISRDAEEIERVY